MQIIEELKLNASCSLCKSYNKTLEQVPCGHLVCEKCLVSNEKCISCNIKFYSRTTSSENTLNEFFSNIDCLSEISTLIKESSFNNGITNVKLFLAPYSVISKQDHKGETRLHKECRAGKLDKVQELLNLGIDVNVQDFAGWTALHEAVFAQQIDVAKLLLDYGALADVPSLNYLTPLHCAIQYKNANLIKLLIEYGSSLLYTSKDGKTALDMCVNWEDIKSDVCLTQTRSNLCKVYTVPNLTAFFLNVPTEIVNKFLKHPETVLGTEKNLLNVGDIKYLVVKNEPTNIKYLQAAMLQGACVVSIHWVNQLVDSNHIVNPLNYLAQVPEFSIERAAMNMFEKLPKLFDGLRFYFSDVDSQEINNQVYTLKDFKMLVQLGGGTILVRVPKQITEQDLYYPYHAMQSKTLNRTTIYLIYNETKGVTKQINRLEMKQRSSKWLIKCINNFAVID